MEPCSKRWLLLRQDDNGNRFLVDTYVSREAAEIRMAELMKGKHKQIYWINHDAGEDHGILRAS